MTGTSDAQMIFIDSNILIDLSQPEDRWYAWSADAIGAMGADVALVANHVVLAEFSVRYPALPPVLTFLASLGVTIEPIGDMVAFRAGKAQKAYRRAGGDRKGVLADFLIGAHAESLGATLLTRDRQRFAAYFPNLPLITPET